MWSDTDVVLIAEDLPASPLPRADLFLDGPPGVQVVAYTPEEFERQLARRNPLAVEATTLGIPIGPADPAQPMTTS